PLTPPPRATLFPYTTLFRSAELDEEELRALLFGQQQVADPAVVRLVAGELAAQPGLEALALRRRLVVLAAEQGQVPDVGLVRREDRKSTRLNSSHDQTSYAV